MAAQADTDVYLEKLEEAASIANLRRAGYPCLMDYYVQMHQR